MMKFSLMNAIARPSFRLWGSQHHRGMITFTKKEVNPEESEKNSTKNFKGMEIIFLGTSSSRPTKTRNNSSLALRFENEVLLFDCGEGCQSRLLNTEFAILGLPGILLDLAVNHTKNKKPLDIYGPYGLKKFLNVTFSVTGSAFPYRVHELQTKSGPLGFEAFDSRASPFIRKNDKGIFPLVTTPRYTIEAVPIKHSVTCFGFVFREKETLGTLNIEKLRSFGVTNHHDFRKVKRGVAVQAPDGRMIQPSEVLGASKPGRKVVILGDTYDPSNIAELAKDADVLIHEATLDDSLREDAIFKAHSTAGMAGEFAQKIGAKNLVLTHFSPRYDDFELVNLMMDAAKHFQRTAIFTAKDLDVYELLRPPRQLAEEGKEKGDSEGEAEADAVSQTV